MGAYACREKVSCPARQGSKRPAPVLDRFPPPIAAVDPQYPIFVLALCVFQKTHYTRAVVPGIQSFKFRHFGHDIVVLHEHEIRKEKGRFRFNDRAEKASFLDELTDLIEASHFIVISCVIDKSMLKEHVLLPTNPYDLALGSCLETLFELVRENRQDGELTHVVVECRGKREDRALEAHFRKICAGSNRWGKPLPFVIEFADKKTNSSGLQLADLVARPIGLSVLRPDNQNRAFETLKRKFFCKGGRHEAGVDFVGSGLKVIPAVESEKPR
jgi:hypothetical protein